jgi:formylmethanofuran dehydrogenase subunit E
MELREIEAMLAKLQKVGFAACETCHKQMQFSDIELHNGNYLCPECMKKEIWKTEGEVELPAS